MKVISIGRNSSSDIYIEDPRVSRRHAAIRVHSFGGIEIIDYSQNGTTVNSRRIKPNSFYPVKRGDDIVFADAVSLDWSLVPKPKGLVYGSMVIAVILVVVVAFLIIRQVPRSGNSMGDENQVNSYVTDSLQHSAPKEFKPSEQTISDKHDDNSNTDSFLKRLWEKENKKADKKSKPNDSDKSVVEEGDSETQPAEQSESSENINPYL